MLTLASNLELNYPGIAELPARIEAAAAAGFTEAELWTTSGRDLDAIAAALDANGVRLRSVVAEPRMNTAWPDADLGVFSDGLRRSVDAARLLGAEFVILDPGLGFPGQQRTMQVDRLIDVYGDAAEAVRGSGVTLLMEAVNTRVDHPGLLIDHHADVVRIVRAIDAPELRVLFDVYHSAAGGEDAEAEFLAAADLVRYIHVADVPGRGAPGTGAIDWPGLVGVIEAAGYSGSIALEFVPTTDMADAASVIRAAIGERAVR